MSSASNDFPDCFDYQQNLINYKEQQFPFRTLWCDEYNCEVMFSVDTLNDILLDKHGVWLNSIAQYIDNKIMYYVNVSDITQSDTYLRSILKSILS